MSKRYFKKFLILLSLSTITIYQYVNAQPDTIWTKTFGGSNSDYSRCVQQTVDGGYIISGVSRSFGPGFSNIWIIKTDANGDTLWTKTFGGVAKNHGIFVQQTSDSGYIIFGNTNSFGAGLWDCWVIKTDVNGDTLWTKTYGGSADEYIYAGQQTADSGYIIAGFTESFGTGSRDGWLIKTNVSGDTLWAKTFGGTKSDEGHSVEQTSDGGYILAGMTASYGLGSPEFWLIKTDAIGDTLWTKTFGGNDWDIANFVQQTSDGGYITTGSTASFGMGDLNIWLLKTDANGDTLWTKLIGGPGDDEGYSVQQTNDGGYIIAGYTESFGIGSRDAWLLKTDTNGDTLWTKIFGANLWDLCYSVQQTTDWGYIVAGETESFSVGSTDYWLIRLAPDATAIDENPQASRNGRQLKQNYPNPFNPTTSIHYSIGSKQRVLLRVFDLLGKEISTLVDEKKPAGAHTVEFDASTLPSGIYFYQLRTSVFTETKKMILIR